VHSPAQQTPISGGCAVPTAMNYNSNALHHDGSCVYTIPGCTDSSAINYRSDATMENAGAEAGTCHYAGCLQPSARNYDPSATVPRICLPPVVGCTDPSATNFYKGATQEDGSCVYAGCTNSSRRNYNPSATLDDGRCTAVLVGCTDSEGLNYHPVFTTSCLVGCCSIPGCTDPTDARYSSKATFDDGSCSRQVGSRRRLSSPHIGCLDLRATTHDSLAVRHEAAMCQYAHVGCTDPTASNYLSIATTDSVPSQCLFLPSGCSVPSALNYDSRAVVLEGCVHRHLGCTNQSSLAYVSSATVDDGSCLLTVGVDLRTGCADHTAANFDSLATLDDGSCRWEYDGCTDSTADNYNARAGRDDGSCFLLFCLDPAASNYEGERLRVWNASRLATHAPGLPPSATVIGNKTCSYAEWSSPPPSPMPAPTSPSVLELAIGGQSLSSMGRASASPDWMHHDSAIASVVAAILAALAVLACAGCLCTRRCACRCSRPRLELRRSSSAQKPGVSSQSSAASHPRPGLMLPSGSLGESSFGSMCAPAPADAITTPKMRSEEESLPVGRQESFASSSQDPATPVRVLGDSNGPKSTRAPTVPPTPMLPPSLHEMVSPPASPPIPRNPHILNLGSTSRFPQAPASPHGTGRHTPRPGCPCRFCLLAFDEDMGGDEDDGGAGSMAFEDEIDEFGNPRRGAALASSTAAGSAAAVGAAGAATPAHSVKGAFDMSELEMDAEDASDFAHRWLSHLRVQHTSSGAAMEGPSSPLNSSNLRQHLDKVGRMDPRERLGSWRDSDAV